MLEDASCFSELEPLMVFQEVFGSMIFNARIFDTNISEIVNKRGA